MSLGRGFTLAPYCLLRAQGGRRSSGQAANDRQWTRLATRGARLAAAAVTGSLLLYVWRRGTREEAGQALTRVSGVDPLYHRVQSNAAPSRHGKGEKMQRGGRQGERFAGKVVVITGAAGDIGGATAAAFARERARLVLVDLPHTRPALEAQSGQLEASGADRAVVFTADVRREEDVQAMVAYTLQIMGIVFRVCESDSHTRCSNLFLHRSYQLFIQQCRYPGATGPGADTKLRDVPKGHRGQRGGCLPLSEACVSVHGQLWGWSHCEHSQRSRHAGPSQHGCLRCLQTCSGWAHKDGS